MIERAITGLGAPDEPFRTSSEAIGGQAVTVPELTELPSEDHVIIDRLAIPKRPRGTETRLTHARIVISGSENEATLTFGGLWSESQLRRSRRSLGTIQDPGSECLWRSTKFAPPRYSSQSIPTTSTSRFYVAIRRFVAFHRRTVRLSNFLGESLRGMAPRVLRD